METVLKKKMLGIVVMFLICFSAYSLPVGFGYFGEKYIDLIPMINTTHITRLGTSFCVVTADKKPQIKKILTDCYPLTEKWGDRTDMFGAIRAFIKNIEAQIHELSGITEIYLFVATDGIHNVWKSNQSKELQEFAEFIKGASSSLPIRIIPIEVRPGNRYSPDPKRPGFKELLTMANSEHTNLHKLPDFFEASSGLNSILDCIADNIGVYFLMDVSKSLTDTTKVTIDAVESAIVKMLKDEEHYVYMPPVQNFLRGDDNDPAASPAHRVSISAFFMKPTVVTEAEYYAFCGTPAEKESFKDSMLPMTCSWNQAAKFANELSKLHNRKPVYTFAPDGTVVHINRGANGYRLPTEAEWEYSARGKTSGSWFHTGNTITAEDAVYDRSEVAPVKSTRPNAYGLYSMEGNVREWVQDWFSAYSGEETSNPTGPEYGVAKVMKGGSYLEAMEALRITARYYEEPNFSDDYVGFRLVYFAESDNQ